MKFLKYFLITILKVWVMLILVTLVVVFVSNFFPKKPLFPEGTPYREIPL